MNFLHLCLPAGVTTVHQPPKAAYASSTDLTGTYITPLARCVCATCWWESRDVPL